jgi:hypothetical protein
MTKLSINNIAILLSITSAFLGVAAQAASPVQSSWEVSGEFNDANNNGAIWKYGYKPVVGGALALLGTPTAFPVQPGFQHSVTQQLPLIVHNVNMAPWTGGPSVPQHITMPARGVQMHPGTSGEVAVIRFVAPYAALYQVSGQFYGLDANGSGTHTSVRILANYSSTISSVIYSGSVAIPIQNAASFTSKLVMLQAGQSLDFEVAAGPSNNYFFGSTGIHAVIQKVGPWCGLTNPANPKSNTC